MARRQQQLLALFSRGVRPSWGPSCSCHAQGTQPASQIHTATVPVAREGSVQDAPIASSSSPFGLVEDEAAIVSERLRHSVASSVPALQDAARYFFKPGVLGKQLRPKLSLLMASALASAPPAAADLSVDLRPANEHAPEQRRRQQRLAEISELIHVASLLHDDVIDEASTRRGISSLNAVVGNKRAILAGDFLLARASVSLAALHNTEVVELMSQVLEHLVTGEIMQLTATEDQMLDMEYYLQKTYCKTASLMANSLKAVAVLAGEPQEVKNICWNYGRHLGLAFQIVDDVLDLTQASTELGKPAHNDIRSGLATAPVLFAADERPELRPMVLRRFKGPSDVEDATALIASSSGIARARELAAQHCLMASELVQKLPQPRSEHATLNRAALIQITQLVLNRTK